MTDVKGFWRGFCTGTHIFWLVGGPAYSIAGGIAWVWTGKPAMGIAALLVAAGSTFAWIVYYRTGLLR